MGERMFNDEQVGYMRDLASMPRESKCACGWYVVGECQSCPTEKGGRTPHLATCGYERTKHRGSRGYYEGPPEPCNCGAWQTDWARGDAARTAPRV